MSTTYYMPANDSGKADFLDHLANNLPRYKTQLGISDEAVASVIADSMSFRYTLNSMNTMQANGQAWTGFKNLLRDGVLGFTSTAWPVTPVLSTPTPVAVLPGIIPRLTNLVAQLKANKNYSASIGHDLWLIGTHSPIDPSTWKPHLSIKKNAGHPTIVWNKGGATAIEIWVDRNDDAGFMLLTTNTEPNTPDGSRLPLSGTSAVWHYKAIYIYHDVQVGQWSDIISVAVGL